jgi:hypothetical protein
MSTPIPFSASSRILFSSALSSRIALCLALSSLFSLRLALHLPSNPVGGIWLVVSATSGSYDCRPVMLSNGMPGIATPDGNDDASGGAMGWYAFGTGVPCRNDTLRLTISSFLASRLSLVSVLFLPCKVAESWPVDGRCVPIVMDEGVGGLYLIEVAVISCGLYRDVLGLVGDMAVDCDCHSSGMGCVAIGGEYLCGGLGLRVRTGASILFLI